MRSLDEIKSNKKVMITPSPMNALGMVTGLLTLDGNLRAGFCMGANEEGNEHVSIELYAHRLPTWSEMCEVKDIFWNEEEEVVQIHPKKSHYVNMTEALHLWRPVDGDWNRLMGENG